MTSVSLNNKCSSPATTTNSVAQFFGNLIPPKVEVRMGATFSQYVDPTLANDSSGLSASKPINIIKSCQADGSSVGNNSLSDNASGGSKQLCINRNNGCGNGSASTSNDNSQMCHVNTGNDSNGGGNGGNGQKKARKQARRENCNKQNQTFSTSVDDPIMSEDFDFEGNLALFDKQALWDVIEAEQSLDVAASQAKLLKQKKYRHDENILVSEPLELRQIETIFEGSTDFVTGESFYT